MKLLTRPRIMFGDKQRLELENDCSAGHLKRIIQFNPTRYGIKEDANCTSPAFVKSSKQKPVCLVRHIEEAAAVDQTPQRQSLQMHQGH